MSDLVELDKENGITKATSYDANGNLTGQQIIRQIASQESIPKLKQERNSKMQFYSHECYGYDCKLNRRFFAQVPREMAAGGHEFMATQAEKFSVKA